MTHREQIEAWSHDRHPHDRLLLAQADRPARRRPDLASVAVVAGAVWAVAMIILVALQ